MNIQLRTWFFFTLIIGSSMGCMDSPHPKENNVYSEKNGGLLACETEPALGYELGYETPMNLVSFHGHRLLPHTANAFYAMQQNALLDGVELTLIQGFLEHSLLEELYECGPKGTCLCNNCNEVPYPGYSSHQAGTGIDIRIDAVGAQEWLAEHAGDFGFTNEILGFFWHWVYTPVDPFNGPCDVSSEGFGVQLLDHPNGQGYWTLTSEGQITPFGAVDYFGAPEAPEFPHTWVGMAATHSGNGYWVLQSTGTVASFGDAPNWGDATISFESGPCVGIAGYGGDAGYWVGTRDGSIQVFGNAPPLLQGSVDPGDAPVVALVSSTDRNGFWTLREDGALGLFNAPFLGNLAGVNLSSIATGMTATLSGAGYWILLEDGTIYPFGDAANYGSVTGLTDSPVVDILRTPAETPGYWVYEEANVITGLGSAGILPQGVIGTSDGPDLEPPFMLRVSENPDRSDPQLLEGITVSGDFYVFVSPNGEVSRARFAIDSDPTTGIPIGDDNTWPFDLGGGTPAAANPYDSYAIENGEHILTVALERLHGLKTTVISIPFTVDNPVCGDGKLEAPEQCDSGPCCEPTKCQLLAAGTSCRPKGGDCDIEEFCLGGTPLCPADTWVPAETLCRPAGTVCDIEELCLGTGPGCPVNQVIPDGTPCLDGGSCLLGFCEVDEPDIVEPIEDVDSEEEDATPSGEDSWSEEDSDSETPPEDALFPEDSVEDPEEDTTPTVDDTTLWPDDTSSPGADTLVDAEPPKTDAVESVGDGEMPFSDANSSSNTKDSAHADSALDGDEEALNPGNTDPADLSSEKSSEGCRSGGSPALHFFPLLLLGLLLGSLLPKSPFRIRS